jgi:RimJ/RimL family protein N-acetyltransferase
LLEGRSVNLRVVEKEDVDFLFECMNNTDFYGEYDPITQISRTEMLKKLENPSPFAVETQRATFIIEKKDKTRIGFVRSAFTRPNGYMEIGYLIIPSERRKGYATEAAQIIVDYLFLSKDIVRIQAGTNIKNKVSQKVLENVGFKKEGTIRKSAFVKGQWADGYLYSILREEWKEPKILTRTEK